LNNKHHYCRIFLKSFCVWASWGGTLQPLILSLGRHTKQILSKLHC
jgi:hypothetical protein